MKERKKKRRKEEKRRLQNGGDSWSIHTFVYKIHQLSNLLVAKI